MGVVVGHVNTCFFSAVNQSPREPKKVPDVYTIFRPPYWCTKEVHQYGVSYWAL